MVVSDGGSHDGGGTDGAGSAILTISPTSNPFGDQVVGSQMMFLGEPAAEVGTTIAAHPGSRKGGVDLALRRRRVVHLACSTGDD